MMKKLLLILLFPVLIGAAELALDLSKYFSADILSIMSENEKQVYRAKIQNLLKSNDEGYTKFLLRDSIELLNKRLAESRRQQQPVSSCVAQHRQPTAAALAAQAASGTLQTGTVYLYKQPTKGSITLNACTYSMLADAEFIYNALQNNNIVTLPPEACPVDWGQKAQRKLGGLEAALQPTNEDILKLITEFNILSHGNFAIIDQMGDVAENATPAPKLIEEIDYSNVAMGMPLLGKAINELKSRLETIQIFLINKPGHWFVIVAHKKNNKVTFYISDRDQPVLKDYHLTAVNLLKKLVGIR